MCSWFCETFCCFLLQWRDSCTQDTSTNARNKSKNTEWPTRVQPPRPQRQVNVRESAQVPKTSARIYGLENVQPKPKPAMSVPKKSQQLRINKPLPPLLPSINVSRFDLSTADDFQGLGRRAVEPPRVSTRNRAIDASPGDIGLISVSTHMVRALIHYGRYPPISRLVICYLKQASSNVNPSHLF